MQLKNTKDHFGVVHRLFHWIVAALIILLLGIGFYMGGASAEWRKSLYGLHKSTGMLALALVVARIGWRSLSLVPGLPGGLHPLYKTTAHASVWVLYAIMLAMPICGYLTSAAGGHPVSFYGLFIIPSVVGKDSQLSHLAGQAHEVLGFLLIGLIGLHISAAFYHHFYLRDNVLKRMLRSGQ